MLALLALMPFALISCGSDDDDDNPSSSRNVLDMCSHIMKQMNFKSVAEGVENEKQLQRLKDLGCDYIQGYYFSKPLPIVDFEEYLRKEV